MEQFSLEKWLQDKSRKVVTRDGKEVELFYSTTSKIPLIGKVSDSVFSVLHQYTKDGFQCDTMNQAKNDLFFADEEEEMTIFEKRFIDLIRFWMSGNTNPEENLIQSRFDAKELLDLARKELEKDIERSAVEFAKFYMEDVNPSFEKVQESEELWKWKMSCLRGVNKAYTQGKQDTMKDLPNFTKAKENRCLPYYVVKFDKDGNIILSDIVYEGEYFIMLQSLKTLPKEE